QQELATGAPICDTRLLTVLADFDGLTAAQARLAEAAIDRQTGGRPRHRDARWLVEVGPQQRGGRFEQTAPLAVGEGADRRERMQLARPEDLALVDVADPTGDALVEEGLGDRPSGLAQPPGPNDALVEIDVLTAQIGAELAEPR